MLRFRELGLEDKAIFDKALKTDHPKTSELTFTNLFVWRRSRKIEYARHEHGLFLRICHDSVNCFLPPIGYPQPEKAYRILVKWAKTKGLRHFEVLRVPEKHLLSFETAEWRIKENRAQFDYIYRTETLTQLPGRHLDGKRGFVRKFTGSYPHRYEVYHSGLKDACLELAENWVAARSPEDEALLAEYDAIRELLSHNDVLHTRGGVLMSGERAVAFAFGEALNDDTFVVHFEKADTSFQGSYQAINFLFIKEEAREKYAFVNREQDLGIPGLRKAKKSYQPIKMEKKYTAHWKSH